MAGQESNEEKQAGEFEALKAIYSDGCQDLRAKAAWGAWVPLNLSVLLTPTEGSSRIGHETNVQVDLHVICCENYPDREPQIKLENPRGISDKVLSILLNELQEKCKKRTGEVVIFDLVEHGRDFLHHHDKPATKSFYDDMLLRRREDQERVEEEQRRQRDLEKQGIQEDLEQRREQFKLAMRKHREHRLSLESVDSNETGRPRHSSCEVSDETRVCQHNIPSVLKFNNETTIDVGYCNDHINDNCVVFYGFDRNTRQMYMIYQFKLSSGSSYHVQLSKIEEEFNYLTRLKHPNLCHYFNIKLENKAENKAVVYILQEFILGLSCNTLYLKKSNAVHLNINTYSTLKSIIVGVLNVLEFLHRNNVLHKALSSRCVYIDHTGTIRVSNYGGYKRLLKLSTQSQLNTTYNKKTDIYKFGIFILSLIKSTEINEENLEIPSSLHPNLYDFLHKSLLRDETDRYTATQLLKHPFLNEPLETMLPLRGNGQQDRTNSPEIQSNLEQIAYSGGGGQSRVQREFEFIAHLGNGAFGEVNKMRNLLDQRSYAVKRIKLNPRSKQLNKKIIREVKLLSQLNHENVVRYYNAWIETATCSSEENDDSSECSSPGTSQNGVKKVIDENLNPPKAWRTMCEREIKLPADYATLSGDEDDEDADDDDDDDDHVDDDDDDDDSQDVNEDIKQPIKSVESDSDSIVFERDETDVSATKSNKEIDTTITVNKEEIQFMYIQMEFCEKSTLRTAIDTELYLDHNRVWRLFREIVEGLAHIHQKGMIHRDLKPMNIFLDSQDHVKIGDFGLATTNVLTKTKEIFVSVNGSENTDERALTGNVGTTLYVAPELNFSNKVIYNQKVDLYSLGIIFFEMSYKPLKTGMERVEIITKLRNKDICFPDDFMTNGTENQLKVITWLLDHDAIKRPRLEELLKSDYIPQPLLCDKDLKEYLRQTLNNPKVKSYKYLVETFHQQNVTPGQDYFYDNQGRHQTDCNIVGKSLFRKNVLDIITKIFETHGGINLTTPLLMPKSEHYEWADSHVKLVSIDGSSVMIPYDLRVPFARYIARRGINSLRRYSTERVYREKKTEGVIPKEYHECAFDIVTPTSGKLMADAEIIYLLKKIEQQIPQLKNKNLSLVLNHASILNAIFLHCGLKDQHEMLCGLLSDWKEGKVSKLQVHTHLISKGLSDNSIDQLFSYLNFENTWSEAANKLEVVIRKRNETSDLAQKGLSELNLIVKNVEAFMNETKGFKILISLGLVRNIHLYSGMICELVWEEKKRHKQLKHVLASGGRYDELVKIYRKVGVDAKEISEMKQAAVGVSIFFDKLLDAIKRNDDDDTDNGKHSHLNVVVCALGEDVSLTSKTKILCDLWKVGIKCALIEGHSLSDVQEQCQVLNVPYMIVLKQTGANLEIKLRSDLYRVSEKRLNLKNVVETMQKLLKCGETTEIRHVQNDDHVNIIYLGEKSKKNQENWICDQLEPVLKKFKCPVLVMVTNLDMNSIIAIYEVWNRWTNGGGGDYFFKTVLKQLDKNERLRQDKSILEDICSSVVEKLQDPSKPIGILYGNGGCFKVLMCSF